MDGCKEGFMKDECVDGLVMVEVVELVAEKVGLNG
jgi:hypothetical protein